MKLWHCHDARSLRALWALEEMNLEYDLEVMPFPPRFLHDGYLDINVLGTVPYFVDGDAHMTESTAICHYLIEKYQKYEFGLRPDQAQFGQYLNWLYHSDATLTFPQTVFLRYTRLEPDETKAAVGNDYRKWYLARLRMLNKRVMDHEFLVADRFTIADIACGYALLLGENLGINENYKPQTLDYLARLKSRKGFQRAQTAQLTHAPAEVQGPPG
ncbi:MAG: glutathione S-transferase family protein [Pseudomonadales bacterium]|nr:glutathione S-transferase family protein [Pseudomonadales bacterium]